MSRPARASVPTLLTALMGGSLSRAELQGRLGGISQPTVSRLIGAAGEQVVTLGRAAATRYGAVRALPRLGSRIPMYRLDEQGGIHVLGWLVPLLGGEFWCEFADHHDVLHEGLPHFLADMRPQGFMGRDFVQRFARELGLPLRLNDWNDDAHLLAMALFGPDLPGNLIMGDESLRHHYVMREHELRSRDDVRAQDYPDRAANSLATDPGSSAGGEQPKFTSAWQDAQGAHHVIVKFSPTGDAPAALRWRDLLRAEQLALEVLRDHGLSAARSELLIIGERLFLEVERFDRVGRHGRRGLLSMAAIDDHRFGFRDSWSACAVRMQHEKMITAEEARQIIMLDTFGGMIANTDRHFGNISLFIDDFVYSLAPAYDMLPMLYRPAETGDVVSREFSPPYPDALNREVWRDALEMALEYWRRLSGMTELSPEFRLIANQNHVALMRLRHLPLPG